MMFLITILVSLCPFGIAKEMVAVGEVFSKDGKKLYDFKQYKNIEPKGREETTIYFNENDKPLLKERILIDNGDFEEYEVNQNQSGKSAVVRKNNSSLEFKLNSDSDNKKSQVEFPSDFAIGSTIVHLVETNLYKLQQGEDVDFQLGLWARQKLIGFFLRKKDEDKKTIRVRMSPSNFFIRQFVDDIYFIFDKKTKKLLEYRGRTNLLVKEDDEWEPLDAIVKYQSVSSRKIQKK